MDITGGKEEEVPIEQQLEALEDERKEIDEAHDSGSISTQEYKKLISKNKFQRAQIIEKNEQTLQRQQQQTFERTRDRFND